jgi:hypothetical protein
MHIRDVIAAAAVIACVTGCGDVIQTYAAELDVSGPGTVKVGSSARIVISVNPNSNVAQLAILFKDGWLIDNDLVSAGACKRSTSIAGELICGSLKAGQLATFPLTAIATKPGSSSYTVAVRDIASSGAGSQAILTGVHGTEVLLHFTEVVN